LTEVIISGIVWAVNKKEVRQMSIKLEICGLRNRAEVLEAADFLRDLAETMTARVAVAPMPAEQVDVVIQPDPPPAVEAPDPPPAPPAPPAEAPKLDADGCPWDERIHSKGKTILKETGLWRLKRGIDLAVVDAVKAELVGTPPPAPPAPPVSTGLPPMPEPPIDYPQLVAKMRDAGLSMEQMNALAVAHGLESIVFAAGDNEVVWKMYNDPSIN
jgi:hypothetical protein